MSPKKAVYLRAQAAILRSSGVSVRETARILQKSKSWEAMWSSSQEFYDKPRSGRPSVLDRTAKKVIEKAKYKRGNSTRKSRAEYYITTRRCGSVYLGAVVLGVSEHAR